MEIWLLQYRINEYDQDGYYTTNWFTEKPSIEMLAKYIFNEPIDGLEDEQILTIADTYTGREAKYEKYYTYRLIRSTDGNIKMD